MANRTRVDDKPENAFQGHSEVKGQMSAFFQSENIYMVLNSLMYAIKCNLVNFSQYT